MMTNTKNYTMRHRLNREIDHSEDFRKRFMTQEYGNYAKYDTNRIKVEYKENEEKEDVDKFYQNYLDMIKKMPTLDSVEMKKRERKNIHDMITDQKSAHEEFAEKYLRFKEGKKPQRWDEDDER